MACLFAAMLATAHAAFDVRAVRLSDTPGVITLDYFAWDSGSGRLWIPAGNTGSVVVLDRAGDVTGIVGGFGTAEFTLGTKRGRLGPSSVALGEGVAYVGNRADSSICTIDALALKRRACLRIAPASQGWAAAPDAVVYVRATKEVWVTRGAPPLGIASSDKSITVYDASDRDTLKRKASIALRASAEGYAVDDARGRFYTNLEETRETIAIDVRRRTIVQRYHSGCDEPRGLALDRERGFLFVACSARVVSIDVSRGGNVVSSIDTGDGLDNIDYSDADRLLYAAASNAATLTIARVRDDGSFEAPAVVPTAKGARGVVGAGKGRAYVADPLGARMLLVTETAR